MNVKRWYGNKFALPAQQIRFFSELSKEQIEEVREKFTAGLVNVEKYVYAVKRSGKLVWARERRDLSMEHNLTTER